MEDFKTSQSQNKTIKRFLAILVTAFFLYVFFGLIIGVESTTFIRFVISVFIFGGLLFTFAGLELKISLTSYFAKYIFPKRLTVSIISIALSIGLAIIGIFGLLDSNFGNLSFGKISIVIIISLGFFVLSYLIKNEFRSVIDSVLAIPKSTALVTFAVALSVLVTACGIIETKSPLPSIQTEFFLIFSGLACLVNVIISNHKSQKNDYNRYEQEAMVPEIYNGDPKTPSELDKEANDIKSSRSYLMLNRSDEVLKIYKKYTGNEIESSRLVYYFAKALHNVGRLEEARTILEKKISNLEKEGSKANPYLHLKLGLVYFWMRKYKSAIEQQRKALRLNRNCTLAKVLLALCLAEVQYRKNRQSKPKAFDEYINKIQNAVEALNKRDDISSEIKKSELVMYNDIKGYVYYLKGDYASAQKELSKVLGEKNYDYGWAHFHLGLVFWEKQKFAKALFHLETAVALEENNPYNTVLSKAANKRIIKIKNDMYEHELGSTHVFDHEDMKRAA